LLHEANTTEILEDDSHADVKELRYLLIWLQEVSGTYGNETEVSRRKMRNLLISLATALYASKSVLNAVKVLGRS
jgi:hypothetical protein